MAIKNLGHYVGEVEDIDTKSLKYKMLEERHKILIHLSIERAKLSEALKDIDETIKQIKEEIKPEIESKQIDWAWIWMKKSGRVKWKQEFINALGRNKAKEITKQYKTKEYPQIAVQFIDPIPESIVQIKENPSKLPVTKHRLSKTG